MSNSWDPMDCSPPGFSVHGLSQARILEWVAISFSRWSSQPMDQTQVSCIVRRPFTHWATKEANKSNWEKHSNSSKWGPNVRKRKGSKFQTLPFLLCDSTWPMFLRNYSISSKGHLTNQRKVLLTSIHLLVQREMRRDMTPWQDIE